MRPVVGLENFTQVWQTARRQDGVESRLVCANFVLPCGEKNSPSIIFAALNFNAHLFMSFLSSESLQ